MTELLNKIFENWGLLTTTALGTWAIAHFSYHTRHENQKSQIDRLRGQVDEYKSKLGGASPDDAKARIEQLERRVGPPYPLTEPQEVRLRAALASITPAARFQVLIMSPVDAAEYGDRMQNIFKSSGWTVTFQATPFMPSEASGIHVLKPRGSQVAEHISIARSLMKLFDDAGVDVGSSEQDLRPHQVVLLVARPPI